jgi:uncharacterized protein (UPF0335 family)
MDRIQWTGGQGVQRLTLECVGIMSQMHQVHQDMLAAAEHERLLLEHFNNSLRDDLTDFQDANAAFAKSDKALKAENRHLMKRVRVLEEEKKTLIQDYRRLLLTAEATFEVSGILSRQLAASRKRVRINKVPVECPETHEETMERYQTANQEKVYDYESDTTVLDDE